MEAERQQRDRAFKETRQFASPKSFRPFDRYVHRVRCLLIIVLPEYSREMTREWKLIQLEKSLSTFSFFKYYHS